MQRLKWFLDKFLELLVMVSMAVLTLDVLWQVFARYVLRNPSSWSQELAIFLVIWVALLGGAVGLGRGAHLGIDYFVGRLPERDRLWTEIFVFTVVALFSLLVMVCGGIELVARTLELQQISVALHIPMGYVYLAVPISGGFMLLYSLLGLIERVKTLIQGESR